MSARLRKRLAGLGLVLIGVFFVAAQVAWRTDAAPHRLPRLPVAVGNTVIFLIGLLGLLLIYLGWRLIRSREEKNCTNDDALEKAPGARRANPEE